MNKPPLVLLPYVPWPHPLPENLSSLAEMASRLEDTDDGMEASSILLTLQVMFGLEADCARKHEIAAVQAKAEKACRRILESKARNNTGGRKPRKQAD